MDDDADAVHDAAFRQTLRFERRPDVLIIDVRTEPGGGVGQHFHPAAEETWRVLDGEVAFRLDGEERRLGAGDSLVAAAGSDHAFENVGATESHLVAEFRPPGTLEAFLREAAALAATGAWDHRGRPRSWSGLLAAADLAMRFRHETVLSGFPLPGPRGQRALFEPLAWLGRRKARRGPPRSTGRP
jgi:quercetin dioxygenase-like cupin family protein